MKFSANNFITPRADIDSKSTAPPGGATVVSAGGMSGQTVPTQNHDMLSLKIIEQPKEEEEIGAGSGDGTMKEYVEDLLNNGVAGRRSSIRVNSLLFEEDSL